MQLQTRPPLRARPPGRASALARAAGTAVLATGLALGLASRAGAIDIGPFTLTGFAKADFTRISSKCPPKDCQVEQFASREFIWSDQLVQGKAYGEGTTHVTLIQPYLGAKFDLPRGIKLSAMLSQRWRDGKKDLEGFWYDKSLTVSHEDFGSLQAGAMTTRAWMFADFPFGTDIGVGDPWSGSGAGYGLLTRALRYTSRPFDVLEGDLVAELTYDIGKSGWKKNKPRFFELWLQYRRGDFGLDVMAQAGKNGPAGSFGKAPFTGLFRDPAFDDALGGSSQGILMAMARYRADAKLEFYGGVRGNSWSGAYAKFLQSKSDNPGGFDIWNSPFNVDWSKDLGNGVYKGYEATSVDLVLGARYMITPKWTAYTGMVHLGPAATDNPSDRGQSNSATFNTLGVNYDYGRGLRLNGVIGMVNYAKRGLAPLSMPSHQSFSGIDSRLEKRGYWLGAGATFTF